MSLDELEARIRREAKYIDFPNRPWMPATKVAGERIFDVVIVGAGQSGLAAAYGLMREQVTNLVVLDAAPAGQEGPWTTFARMVTLRTPKMLSGLDFGNPALSPRAWYEAQWGEEAWNKVTKIPRGLWQDYLAWYRAVLAIPVINDTKVTSISAASSGLRVTAEDGRAFFTRKVVLCTGIDGGGRWEVPLVVTSALPKERYAHTAHAIDFTALKGKRVGVLGNGASAFDNAATALEHGATSVALCLRKPAFPRVNVHKWMETAGFLGHYASLSDIERWRIMRYITSVSQPPPQDTLWRCRNYKNFSIHVGSQWNRVALKGDEIVIDTPVGQMTFDFLIAGTGITYDAKLRPELAEFADEIATWNDVFAPPPEEADPYLGRAPYLTPGFQFTEKHPGSVPQLALIHNFTYGATLSMGLSASSISGMRYGVPRLVRAVTGDLFRADYHHHMSDLLAYQDEEITTLELPDDRSLVPVVEIRHGHL